MSFIFSQALVEASSLDNCSGIDASALSNVSPTLKPSLWLDKTTEPSRLFRSGMTYAHLTEGRGEELLTSWLGGSHAKTSVRPVQDQELTGRGADILNYIDANPEVARATAEQSRDSVIGQCCAAIKAEDDRMADSDYMLDSDDCIRVCRALKSQQDAAIEAKTAEQSVRDAALFDILMRKNIELTDEAYLSMRVVGVPPSEGEFVAALKKAIDAAIESQQGDGS